MYHLGAVSSRRTRYSGVNTLRNTPIKISYPGRSGRYRNLVRSRLKGLGCACQSDGFAGFGDTARVQSTTQYASLGAKAGSVVPGVGTIAGAVVGAVVGAFLSKKKPVRPSAQEINTCQQTVAEYERLIAPYPNQSIGAELGEGSMKAAWLCYEMVVTRDTKDPRFLDGNWQAARDAAVEIVTKTFSTPVGGEITISNEGKRDIKGKLFRPVKVTWINAESNSLASMAAKFQEVLMKGCLNYSKPAACDAIHSAATFRHLCLDLIGWAASTAIPQVEIPKDSAAVLPAPPTAPAAPATPVVAVPTAPPPILTTSVAVPAPSQLFPVPAVPTPQLPGSVSPVPAPPGAPAGAYEQQLAASLRPMIDQLLAQGADQKYAFTAALSSLAQRGIEPTAAVQTAVADVVKDGQQINPWLIVGGGLAIAILTFALGKR